MDAFQFRDTVIEPGHRAAVDIFVSRDAADRPVNLPVRILHGAAPGPTLFLTAALHGDEISGVEIIRRLLAKLKPSKLAGTLIAVPVVNTYGFIAGERYLPDRRDLNRSFPGREEGSLAARLAHLLMSEIVARADVGIDLHSAAAHRYNLPQVRVSPGDEKALDLARAFAPPLIVTSGLLDGSFRAATTEAGVTTLLMEAGEALRFDPFSTRVGVNGILRTMAKLGMISLAAKTPDPQPSLESSRGLWMRAPRGGIATIHRESGRRVTMGETVATVRNPVGDEEVRIKSPIEGIVFGHSRHGVVNRGDALVHIAQLGEDHLLDPELEARLRGRMLEEHEIE